MKRYANVNQNKCVACGACVKVCPKEALQVHKGCYAVVDESICVGCGKCTITCPASVIELINREVCNEK